MTTSDKNVYILGTAYSGSTLLGSALNGHPLIAYAGEISRLPFFDHGPVGTACFVCDIKGEACPIWTDDLKARMEQRGPGEAVDVYRETVGTPVVIDGSKYAQWLRSVQASQPLPPHTRVLLTTKNPFSYASSIKRRDGHEAWLAANMWRDTVFDCLRTLVSLGLPYLVVRYEDFSLEPERLLRKVCGFLDVEFDQRVMSFWKQPVHALGGNLGAYVWYKGVMPDSPAPAQKGGDLHVAQTYEARGFGGWFDSKWRDELTADEISLVLGTPLLGDLCSMMGYKLERLLSGTAL
ncbi:MAG: hypothetical protein CL878_05770 [Dehalococcoidia bacterium]|nr:hypothetical protein [Dehalococcoidia bacterium]